MAGINYDALPTLQKFHGSNALIKGVRGNVGSGKTVGCCFDIFRRSLLQKPYNGVRYSKWAMVRNTYKQLLMTTLETWERWFGDYCHIRRTPPIEAHLKMNCKDGTKVDLRLIFLALDIPADVANVKSLEVTATFINEASEVGRWVLTKCFERRGRYPDPEMGGATWSGVIMDTNSCSTDHWWYRASEEENNQGWEFFDQPPALLKFPETKTKSAGAALEGFYRRNPNFPPELKKKVVRDIAGNLYIANPKAENVQNLALGYDYWLDQIPGKPLDEIKVFILNEYGSVIGGKPVYPEYIESEHKAEEDLKPLKNVGISIGFDFGRKPACVISQITPTGQKRVLEERVTIEHGSMGIKTFSRMVLVPLLLENYLPWLQDWIVTACGDPSGNSGVQTDEKTCFMLLNECPVTHPGRGFPDYKKNAERLKDDSWVQKLKSMAKNGSVSLGDLGVQSRPARTNSFEARRDAVASLLTDYIDDEPAILISPCCKYLLRGISGEWVYKRIQVSGTEKYQDEPDKGHITSHVNDGLQYDCLESLYQASDTTEEDRKKEQAHRAKIGNASCAAWDEVARIRKDLENDEYFVENYC